MNEMNRNETAEVFQKDLNNQWKMSESEKTYLENYSSQQVLCETFHLEKFWTITFCQYFTNKEKETCSGKGTFKN